MSVAIGASAAGARAYTATASQGLLYMSEAVWNAAGLGLPIVMTVANRAIGAPINIWNDHSDAMSQRDAGWLQLYAETSQEALDLHIQAFRIAEELSVPVMVCMDGFLLTHASERADIPEQAQVDAFLPRYEPRQVLDPADPVSIGAMVGPEAFTEVRYLAYERMRQALDVIPRRRGGVHRAVRPGLRRAGPALPDRRRRDRRGRARLGARHAQGHRGRAAGRRHEDRRARHHRFRPFPLDAVREALGRAPGASWCWSGRSPPASAASCPPTSGRHWPDTGPAPVHRDRRPRRPPDHPESLRAMLAAAGDLPPLTFLDLDTGLVEPSGPDARRPPVGTQRREHAQGPRHHRLTDRMSPCPTSGSSSTRPAASRSATGCSARSSAASRPTRAGPTR